MSTHSVVFLSLGFDANQPYEKKSANRLPYDDERGFTPEPDFLCAEYKSATLTVFELKTPYVSQAIVHRNDGNRKKLNANVETYLAQATEYADSIREREDARLTVILDLKMEKISSYKVCLVYGLEKENDPAEISRILANRKVHTIMLHFDSLLDHLSNTYRSARPNTEERDGLCIIYHLIIHPNQRYQRGFIADHGEEKTNRLSVFIENGIVVYQCVDSSGTKHELRSKITLNQPLYLRFEFSNDADGIYMSLNVDNEERDLRVGSVKFDFHPDIRSMYLGANLSGQDCGRFQMLQLYVISKTMKLSQKLESFEYFKRCVSDPSPAVDFDGTRFMIREPSGNLVQQESEHRPVFRNNAGYNDV